MTAADHDAGAWSDYIRECASRFNKTNFYIPGEIVAGESSQTPAFSTFSSRECPGNSFGAIYIGRGMEPGMAQSNLTEVVTTNNATYREYVRPLRYSALDGAAFHYTVYRALTRFLGRSF